jgi:hypothetical protein
MILMPNALARVEDVALELGVADPADFPALTSQVNRASVAIDRYCHGQLRRSERTRILDARGDLLVHLHERPLYSIRELNNDAARVFGLTTIIDPATYTFSQRGEIFLGSILAEGRDTVRAIYEAGYSLPRFIQSAEPVVHTPAEPDDPVAGDLWFDQNGSTWIFALNTELPPVLVWTAYSTFVIPGNVTQATIEYVSFMRRRSMAGDAGLISRDRGFSEGASLNYEITMPVHIAQLLVDEVRVG